MAVLYTLRGWTLAGLKDVLSGASCTSLPQQWDKPRGQKIAGEPVSTMVIAKPGNRRRKRKPVTAVFDDNRYLKKKKKIFAYKCAIRLFFIAKSFSFQVSVCVCACTCNDACVHSFISIINLSCCVTSVFFLRSSIGGGSVCDRF